MNLREAKETVDAIGRFLTEEAMTVGSHDEYEQALLICVLLKRTMRRITDNSTDSGTIPEERGVARCTPWQSGVPGETQAHSAEPPK